MNNEAILCFGMSLNDIEDYRSPALWFEGILKKLGLGDWSETTTEEVMKMWVGYKEGCPPLEKAWEGVHEAEIDYFDTIACLWDATNVEVIEHIDWTTIILASRQSIITSTAGKIIPVNIRRLKKEEDTHRVYLKLFCERFDIPFEEPNWILVEYE